MPLRGKKQSNVITNVHGVRFTQKEAKNYLNLIKRSNKAVKTLTSKLRRLGLDKNTAQGLSGNIFNVSLDVIKDKAGAQQALKHLIKGASVRSIVEQNERMMNNILGIIEGRYGISPRDMYRIEVGLRGLTLAQFVEWAKKNSDLIDIIFDTSPVHGARLVSQDEMDYIAERLKESLGVEL